MVAPRAQRVVSRFVGRRIETTVAVAFVGAVTVATMAIGVVTVALVERVVVSSKVQQLDALAEAKEQEITALLRTYESAADLIASRTRMRELLVEHALQPSEEVEEGISRILRDAVDGSPELVRVATLSNLDGLIVGSTRSSRVGRDLSNVSAQFDEAPALDSGSRLIPFLNESALTMVVRTPVQVDEQVIGVLDSEIPEADLQSAVEAAGFEQTGQILLGTPDPGEGVARFVSPISQDARVTADVIVPLSAADSPMVQALDGQEAAFREGMVDYDGVPVIAATRYLPEVDWGLVVKIDEAEVLGAVHSVRNRLLGLAAGLLIVTLLAALLARVSVAGALAVSRQADQRLARMFHASPIPLLAVDGTGVIRLANDAAGNLLGHPFHELIGRVVEEFVPMDRREHHRQLRAGFNESPMCWRTGSDVDVVAVRGDGLEIPVEVSLTPFEDDGEEVVLAAIVDLTERIEAQRALEDRAERLERLNSELEAFASATAHDLKAPVRSMHMVIGAILEDEQHQMSERVRHDLALVRGRGQRLMDLVDGLLEYARIGRSGGTDEWIDADAMIAGLADLYLPAERFTLDAPTLHRVYGPPAVVELVFRNLLCNAVKHHDRQHGSITIRSGIDQQGVWFTVHDDGPGIPEKHHERVFGLFQTLKSRDEVEGSGLGLSMTKKAVESCGGSIEIVPTGEERGAKFKVSWPSPDRRGEPSQPSEVAHA